MDKDLFTLTTDHFTIEGRSRAGHETWFRIRDLGVMLDLGRGPDAAVGIAAGDVVRIGRTHEVRAHAATHRVAANAYEIVEVRHRLKEEGLSQEEIYRRRAEVIEEYRYPLLFYTGDTDRGILENCDALYRAEVLMIECSFVFDGHQERAATYRHIHFDDIADFAERFENQLIVLTHFSRRYGRAEIRDEVRRRCPAVLRDRLRLALPEPYQRV